MERANWTNSGKKRTLLGLFCARFPLNFLSPNQNEKNKTYVTCENCENEKNILLDSKIRLSSNQALILSFPLSKELFDLIIFLVPFYIYLTRKSNGGVFAHPPLD